ncbi:MAG: Omp28-related outer membrane protein [Alistipes sp.]|nr:Omp28-related outer membrane protein [Alistipes sp.]
MKLTKLFAFLLAAAGLATACGGDDNGDDTPDVSERGTLVLTASAGTMLSNGVDEVTFTVMFTPDGETIAVDVTDKAKIYETGNNSILSSNKFTTGMEGTYKFYASYGPNIAPTVEVVATPEIPELPADPNAASTSFVHRHLLIDHTGTECPNCPYMMSALEQLAEDSEYNSQFLLAASHSYNRTDPMYNQGSAAIGNRLGNGYYPYVMMDLNKNLGVNNSMVAVNVQNLKKLLDNNKVDAPEAGLSAAVSATPVQIIINASVKAAVTGNYRVGMWILEDNIEAVQSGASAPEHNVHSNAVRAIVGSLTNLNGEEVGAIEAGQSANIVRTVNISSNWKIANCKVLLFVTSDADTTTPLKNCVLCPIGGTVAYEYK